MIIGVLVAGIIVGLLIYRSSRNRKHSLPTPPARNGNELFWDHARQTVTLSSTKSQWDEPAATAGSIDLERGDRAPDQGTVM